MCVMYVNNYFCPNLEKYVWVINNYNYRKMNCSLGLRYTIKSNHVSMQKWGTIYTQKIYKWDS